MSPPRRGRSRSAPLALQAPVLLVWLLLRCVGADVPEIERQIRALYEVRLAVLITTVTVSIGICMEFLPSCLRTAELQERCSERALFAAGAQPNQAVLSPATDAEVQRERGEAAENYQGKICGHGAGCRGGRRRRAVGHALGCRSASDESDAGRLHRRAAVVRSVHAAPRAV
eukprot:SAG31_NODE_1796_length_7245_cov_57.374195_7_plen_172_part_00